MVLEKFLNVLETWFPLRVRYLEKIFQKTFWALDAQRAKKGRSHDVIITISVLEIFVI